MKFIRANEMVLHYSDQGGREAPAIVFSNSLGTDFRIWDDVVERLGPGFRFIRYDKRGHGLSDATPAPYTMSDHVGDLSALMDDLNVARATIVGLSVGGMIAQGLAAQRPDLVNALVLCDTGHKIGTADLWNGRIDAIEKGGIAAISDAILERWFSAAYRTDTNADFAAYRNMLERSPVAGYLGTAAAIRDADFTASTSALTVPALCVVGEEDGATVPDLVRELAGLIPGGQFEIIPRAGHLPCIEQPVRLAGLISDFLAEHRLI
jgi:3-oxoadipate enol-lactonase